MEYLKRILSPHVFLFGILFYLDAFEAPGLRSMEELRRLLVEDGCQQMELPLKPEIEEYFHFRIGWWTGSVGI